jgi:hypothetical protein
MKATDFDLSKDIKYDFEKGITTFKESRLVIFDANSMGLLRQDLIDSMGWEKARAFFLRFSFQNGYSDFMQMKLNYKFESEMDLLASGPVIHTWEGIVKAVPTEIKYDKQKGTIFFTGNWFNSYEAEQHLSFNDYSNEPVCWSLAGYASGWTSAFMGKKIIGIEPKCKGKGDGHCGWMLKEVEAWDKELVKPYAQALSKFKIG